MPKQMKLKTLHDAKTVLDMSLGYLAMGDVSGACNTAWQGACWSLKALLDPKNIHALEDDFDALFAQLSAKLPKLADAMKKFGCDKAIRNEHADYCRDWTEEQARPVIAAALRCFRAASKVLANSRVKVDVIGSTMRRYKKDMAKKAARKEARAAKQMEKAAA